MSKFEISLHFLYMLYVVAVAGFFSDKNDTRYVLLVFWNTSYFHIIQPDEPKLSLTLFCRLCHVAALG